MGRRLRDIAEATGDKTVGARGWTLTSLWQSEAGDHAAAESSAARGLALTERDVEPIDDLLVARARLFNRIAVARQTRATAEATPTLLPAAAAAYLEALRLSRRVGDESGELNALAGLATIHLATGEASAAGKRVLEGLAVAVAHRHRWYAWLFLLGLAAAAHRQDAPAEAAAVLGAADALAERSRFQPYAFWGNLARETREAVRAALGSAAFAAHHQRGHLAVAGREPTLADLLALLPPEFADPAAERMVTSGMRSNGRAAAWE